MPTLTELRSRLSTRRDSLASPAGAGESLIADVRGRLTPAQTVELKLRGLLAKPKAEGVGARFRVNRPR
jgi:hypothetical protein